MDWIRAAGVCSAIALTAGPLAALAQSSAPPASATTAAPAARSNRLFNGVSEDHILTEIRTARIIGRWQVGSTSVNFHFRLNADVDCSFKPRSQQHGEAFRAEIAAFRLNRMLGLTRVPPAISRSVATSQLAVGPEVTIVPDSDGRVRGAAIYWVPVLHDSRIDHAREREQWAAWMRQGNAIAPGDMARAEEISTLIVFDMLTGNWDRWSGQNVPMDAAGHLIYRDNNGGFSEPFGDRMMLNVLRYLRMVQKFSRGVIERARAMTEATIRAEMALDPDARPLLNAVQLASLIRRRDTLIAYVDELVHRYGEPNVYAWP